MKPLLARWMIVSLLAVAPAAARTADTATDTAANPDSTATASTLAGRNPAIVTRSGLDIHRRFRAHLAEPECSNASAKWRAHYAAMPKRLTEEDDELLALFGYVVDEFIKAGLPTEYALVPVIESRYNPAARSRRAVRISGSPISAVGSGPSSDASSAMPSPSAFAEPAQS